MSINNDNFLSNDDIKKYIDNLNKIDTTNDEYNLNDFEEEIKQLNDLYSDDAYNVITAQQEYINEITEEIKQYNELNNSIEDYKEEINKNYEEFNKLPEEEKNELEKASLKEEEIAKIRDDFLNKRIEKSETINKLINKIEDTRQQINDLKNKINQDKKEFRFASITAISKEDCKIIFANASMKEIIDTVVSATRANDLATARKAISILLGKSKGKTLLDNIQFLLNNDTNVEQQEPSRPIKIRNVAYGNITNNITIYINSNPVKIIGKTQPTENPGKAPEDMIKNEEKTENTDTWKVTDEKGQVSKDNWEFKESQEKETSNKKNRTANQVYAVYKNYSNSYDKLADEIMELEKRVKEGNADESLLNEIDKKKKKLKDLAEKMKKVLVESREIEKKSIEDTLEKKKLMKIKPQQLKVKLMIIHSKIKNLMKSYKIQ